MVKKELLRKGLLLGIGVAAYAQEKAEQLAKDLVRKGHLNKAEGKKLVRAVYEEAQQSGKRIASTLEKEMKRVLQTVKKPVQKKKKR